MACEEAGSATALTSGLSPPEAASTEACQKCCLPLAFHDNSNAIRSPGAIDSSNVVSLELVSQNPATPQQQEL